jgi:TonB family protein
MREAVSDLIAARSRADEGLAGMLAVSIAAHLALLAAIMLTPDAWGRRDARPERNAMFISLGGAPGPRSGGLTTIGGRPVQQVVPLAAVPRGVVPPAPKPPEMALPSARTSPATKPPAAAPDDAKGRRTSTGDEVRAGSAAAETGAKGVGFGLTTGGGGGTGGYLDVGNFCCPEYLETMRQLIQQNWRSRQQVVGQVQVKFTIERDGALTGVQIEKPSPYFVLNIEAQRAVQLTARLPPLPTLFTEDHLTVHLIFDYHR